MLKCEHFLLHTYLRWILTDCILSPCINNFQFININPLLCIHQSFQIHSGVREKKSSKTYLHAKMPRNVKLVICILNKIRSSCRLHACNTALGFFFFYLSFKFLLSFYFFKSTWRAEWQQGNSETKKKRMRDVLHLLVHFLNTQDSKYWGQSPGP